jgi:hypothetical protein
MKKRVLIVINERPAEGFRVADGLAWNEELEISVLVSDAIAHWLTDETDPHLRALRQRKIPILPERDPQAPALHAKAAVTIEF